MVVVGIGGGGGGWGNATGLVGLVAVEDGVGDVSRGWCGLAAGVGGGASHGVVGGGRPVDVPRRPIVNGRSCSVGTFNGGQQHDLSRMDGWTTITTVMVGSGAATLVGFGFSRLLQY